MLFRRALYLREHRWHGRDLTLTAATIRNFRDGSFQLAVSYAKTIERTIGGKYEDFRCDMPMH